MLRSPLFCLRDRAVAGQAALAEPGKTAPDARDAFEPERFDRFASNVRDRFLDRIGRVDQL
jgi:hypothetical protein